MTANGFCNHEGFHWAWLLCPHCQFALPQKKKEKKMGEKNIARLKCNGLISKIPELSESCEIVFANLLLGFMRESRSNRVSYTLKTILYTIYFPDISDEVAYSTLVLFLCNCQMCHWVKYSWYIIFESCSFKTVKIIWQLNIKHFHRSISSDWNHLNFYLVG